WLPAPLPRIASGRESCCCTGCSFAHLKGCLSASQLVDRGDGQEAVAEVDNIDLEAIRFQAARHKLAVCIDDLGTGCRSQSADDGTLQRRVKLLQRRELFDAQIG